jgi:hypothetical protein
MVDELMAKDSLDGYDLDVENEFVDDWNNEYYV